MTEANRDDVIDLMNENTRLLAEVEHLRGLLCWVYEHHSRGGVNWALVCDEECEIAALAGEGEP